MILSEVGIVMGMMMPVPPPQPPALMEQIRPQSTLDSLFAADNTLMLLSQQLTPQTQAEQMRDAARLKTLQGTKWRLNLISGGSETVPLCPQQTVVFQGFSDQPNKGIVKVSCNNNAVDDTKSYTGKWLTKPSEIRKGAVELSARWKVKMPTSRDNGNKYIFKGFIRADSTLSASGTVAAEMKGAVLLESGGNNGGGAAASERTIAKFQADLIGTNVADEELRMGVE